MPRSDRVLFVSAGMLQPKKRDHVLARRQLYLNYGALTLASLLDLNEVPTTLVHGAHELPEAFIERMRLRGLLPSRYPVMLSLPSFYALGWAQDFCRRLKILHSDSVIIAGGRWVTGPDPAWLRRRIPELDTIVPGLGEAVIKGLLSGEDRSHETAQPPMPDFPLNHHLVEGFTAFQPSIEASRGCGMGCAFCEERAIPLSKLREPELLAEYMARTLTQYSGGEIHPYLQSSFFLPNPRWATRLQREIERRGLNIQWRCETRVDAMKPETVQYLAAAGLKILDLGLETASPRQIIAMNKSGDVDRYLRSASDLLAACKSSGVWVKANVLLYAGETAQTLAETRGWLDQHANAIKGVSVGPVVVYGPPKQAYPLIESFGNEGARVVDSGAAEALGISAIHPSAEIDAKAAEEICLGLSRRYMSQDDYFDLKAFSYYSRHSQRSQFDADVLASDTSKLPFLVQPYTEAPTMAGCFPGSADVIAQ